ncbi:cysteine-rich secretory protein 2-like [Bombina bombina]|uniref:cysteine-rich secretory protein 2-like n=1 Tax=Bombina bombina TaxID=8345 RepID=UPI00235AFE15|nr:cysteine-rich secretory protein 2-like [Bombina bombina]
MVLGLKESLESELDGATTKPHIKDLIVNTHNYYRSIVKPSARNMLKMEWSEEAAEKANHQASRCVMQHSPFSSRRVSNPYEMQCGENILFSSTETDWAKVIQDWDSEKDNFALGVGPKSDKDMVGHYTQLVWDKSFLVGCGVANCPNSQFPYHFVCQYCPAGNDMRRLYKPYKKGKPCADCRGSCDGKLCKPPV